MSKTSKEHRHQYILMCLMRDGRVTTRDLSDTFGITDVAVRGDFDEIGALVKERGLQLHRYYGGVELLTEKQQYRGFGEGGRESEGDSLDHLAEYVVESMIDEWDHLLLDAGRTTNRIAYQLAQTPKEGLRVITNSYAPHFLELYTHGEIEIGQLGGTPVPRSFCYVESPGGDRFFDPFWAGPFKAIITGTGFAPETGLLVNNPSIIAMKQRFIKAASSVILVIGHAKMGKIARGTVTFCGFNKDPWLIQHYEAQRSSGVEHLPVSIPLTIVTDLPAGSKASDLELSEHLTPTVTGRVVVYETEIALST